GDFHVQKQSSRGFLRIIRKIKTPFVIALECLRVTDQPAIESFLSGELSEKDFLSKVAWKKNWGFPWDNYKAIFKWAQLNKVKIYGVNSGKANLTLYERDDFSAKAIKEIYQKNKNTKIFVQYGDLHLASSHLPKSIKQLIVKINLCTVYQSPEILYFKIMEKQKELSTDVVKLSPDIWALNGLPPWIKWQDYLLHLESGFDKRVRVSEVDPTDTVASTVHFLAQSFGLDTKTDSLSIYSADDDNFFNVIGSCSPQLRKKIIENVQEGISFYIPELECGYLARYTVNHITRVAAQFIYYKEGSFSKTIIDPKKDFYKLIWLESIIYFFAKVKNPKRKTDTLQDIRSALQKEQFDDRGKEALMLSLTQKLTELQFLSQGKYKVNQSEEFAKYSKKSFVISSQIIGGIIGEKLFYAFSKRMIKLPLNKTLIFKNLNTSSFQKVYFESLELIESWPISFNSKYDKL
ncbi:MAG: ChaN family lipoprotein, partial [Pseudobdellovibrio sp.]